MIGNGTPLDGMAPLSATDVLLTPSAQQKRNATLATADQEGDDYASAFEMLGSMLDLRGLGIQPHEIDDSRSAFRRYDYEDIKRTRDRLIASGAIALLDKWDSRNGRSGLGGRPEMISRLALLTGLTTLALDKRELWMRNLGSFFKNQIDDRTREMLEVPDPTSKPSLMNKRNWEQNCRNTFQRMLGLVDPFPYRRYEARTYASHKVDHDLHREEGRHREMEMMIRLADLADLLMNMTFQMQPRHLRRGSAKEKINVGFDQTFMTSPLTKSVVEGRLDETIEEEQELAAAGRPKAGPVDTWTGPYVRVTDERLDALPGTAPAFSKPTPNGTSGWAFTLVVRVDDGVGKKRHPKLILAAALGLPGLAVADTAADLLIRIADNGHRPGMAAADKEYWANAIPERLQIPATARGWIPCTEYRADRLGKWGKGHRGAIFVEGQAMCPATPTSIIDATKDRMAGKIDDTTYKVRIKNRRYFRLRPKSKPDAQGNVTMMCPAAGKSPTVTCPLREMLRTASNQTDRWDIEEDDENLPKRELMDDICKQHSVKFTPEDMPPAFQALPYQSPEWRDFHKHSRNSTESLNGTLKSAHSGNFDDHDKRRVRGFAAAYIFMIIMIVAFNIRRIADFLELKEHEARKATPGRPPIMRARDRIWTNRSTATLPGGKSDEVELARRRERKAEKARLARERREAARTHKRQ